MGVLNVQRCNSEDENSLNNVLYNEYLLREIVKYI